MKRLLVRLVAFLGSAAIGLIVANALLDRFSLSADSFVLEVTVFAVLQALLSIVVPRAAVLGAVGLVSTFVALLLTRLLTDGLVIRGIKTWFLATLIVWIVTMLATVLLSRWLVGARHSSGRARRR